MKPGDRQGIGYATYRMTNGGKVVWAGKLPYTLWEARVADDGTVAGYSYGAGFEGWGRPGNDFRTVILDSWGKERLNISEPRKRTRRIHNPDNPIAAGIFIHPDDDRFVLRVRDPDGNRDLEEWRVYSLSTGKMQGRYEPRRLFPDEPRGFWIVSAEGIRDTPLVLINWWDARSSEVGAKFTLVDRGIRPIWSLDLPNDYERAGNAGILLKAEIRRRGAIVDAQTPRAFTIRAVKSNERVTYTVSRNGATWKVSETRREPWK